MEVMSVRDVACEEALRLSGGIYESSVESSSVMLGGGKNREELLRRRDICNAKSCLAFSTERNQLVMLSYGICSLCSKVLLVKKW